MQYVYPALFVKEESGQYSVSFPDLPGCYTGGDDLHDAVEMAQDALCLYLYQLETEKAPIPQPSDIGTMERTGEGIVSLVACDTLEYRKYFGKQAVRKTVTLPAWLNTMAENADISFSAVLQNALKQTLGIS